MSKVINTINIKGDVCKTQMTWGINRISGDGI